MVVVDFMVVVFLGNIETFLKLFFYLQLYMMWMKVIGLDYPWP